jgi:hypothetical protein
MGIEDIFEDKRVDLEFPADGFDHLQDIKPFALDPEGGAGPAMFKNLLH